MKLQYWQDQREKYLRKAFFILPRLTSTLLIILLKSIGLLEGLELNTLDLFLRYRPAESQDQHITLITINEEDLKSLETEQKYPVPDIIIADLLQKVLQAKPIVIGLDLYRPDPVNPGHSAFVKVLDEEEEIPIIIAKKILPQEVQAAPNAKYSGFVDLEIDIDGRSRRAYLGVNPTGKNDGFQFSLPLKLAEQYLKKTNNCTLENSQKDPDAMAFCDVEIPRFSRNFGSYSGENSAGVQSVINFRTGQTPFREYSLQDIRSNNFRVEDLKDHIVIIGMTAISVKDFINTNAVRNSSLIGSIYGVEFIAHVTSHIVNGVIEKRPFIHSLPELYEYLLLILIGGGIILIDYFAKRHIVILLAVDLSILAIGLSLAYFFVIFGLWLPILPISCIIFFGVFSNAFSEYVHTVNQRLTNKKKIIKDAFDYIHNGPLQDLACLLREMNSTQIDNKIVIYKLESLNEALRDVSQYCLENDNTFRLGDGSRFDYSLPLHEILLEIYDRTLKRDILYFNSLKIRIRTFEEIENENISLLNKEYVCKFLEQCLCNVGMHAVGVSKIEVIGENKNSFYSVSIKDNGVGISSKDVEKFKRKLKDLTRSLKAELVIEPLEPKGTLCQLTWKLKKR